LQQPVLKYNVSTTKSQYVPTIAAAIGTLYPMFFMPAGEIAIGGFSFIVILGFTQKGSP